MMRPFRGREKKREKHLWVMCENIICSLNLLKLSRLFSPATSTPSSSSTPPASLRPHAACYRGPNGENKGWEVFIGSIELVFCITKEWNSIARHYPWNPATCSLFYLDVRCKEERWLECGAGRKRGGEQEIWWWAWRAGCADGSSSIIDETKQKASGRLGVQSCLLVM